MKKNRIIGVEAKFSKKQIQLFIQQRLAKLEAVIMLRLTRAGEHFVANARSVNTYKDQTKNLRSSIGYVIMKDGEQVMDSFPGGDSEGKKKGKTVADMLKRKYPTGYALICVAGMEYAAAVESKGFDVVSGSGLRCEAELKKAFEEIQKKFNRKK
jgi:hypothetical protein